MNDEHIIGEDNQKEEQEDGFNVTEYEHIETNEDGSVAGVHTVDVDDVSGVDKWKKVENIISEYVRLHPNYMELFLEENKQERRRQANKYASNDDKNLRYALALPPGLMKALLDFDPQLFKDPQSRHKFMKKFEGFTVCDVV